MKNFQNAQKLFNDYQKHGAIINFIDSLEILDEIIERQGKDSLRATNFKQVIGRYIDSELAECFSKSNVGEFKTSLSDDELWEVLLQALNEKDLTRLLSLIRIKRDYF